MEAWTVEDVTWIKDQLAAVYVLLRILAGCMLMQIGFVVYNDLLRGGYLSLGDRGRRDI